MEKKKSLKNIILGVIASGITIGLVLCFLVAYNNVKTANNQSDTTSTTNTALVSDSSTSTSSSKLMGTTDSKNLKITSGGNYDLSGEYESVIVNTSEEVTLNLNSVTITNSAGPAINIEKAKKVTIVLSGKNKITSTTTEDLDGAIYSKADLVFEGTGSIEVKSNYDGIVSKDTLVIKNGTYTITSSDDGIKGKDSVEIQNGTFTINAGGDGIKSTNDEDLELGYINIAGGTYNITAETDGIQAETNILVKGGDFTITVKDDGIHTSGKIEINAGTFNITAAEGIEATYVKINDGTINISASDDGINAGQKSNIGTPTVEINGGNITITMGQGDTDGVDSNGDIVINGGTISVTGQSTFDYDGTGTINGGTVICNGEKVTTLPNQMMGGGMNGGTPGQMNPNGEMPNGREMQLNGGRRGR